MYVRHFPFSLLGPRCMVSNEENKLYSQEAWVLVNIYKQLGPEPQSRALDATSKIVTCYVRPQGWDGRQNRVATPACVPLNPRDNQAVGELSSSPGWLHPRVVYPQRTAHLCDPATSAQSPWSAGSRYTPGYLQNQTRSTAATQQAVSENRQDTGKLRTD